MSLNLFALSTNQEQLAAELITIFAEWTAEIDKAAPIFDIEGERLERVARDVPQHQFHYAALMQDAKALVKWLEIEKARKEARHLKNYTQNARALGVREQAAYIQGEKDVVESNQLITEANLRAQQFEEIVDTIKQLGWMVGNMTKLRVAELQDAIV